MEFHTDYSRDVRLLDLRGLTPLDAEVVTGDLDLRAMIQGHNARCVRASARLRQVAEDRQRLGDFNTWECKDSATVLVLEQAYFNG
jgi:hypothetical protein